MGAFAFSISYSFDLRKIHDEFVLAVLEALAATGSVLKEWVSTARIEAVAIFQSTF